MNLEQLHQLFLVHHTVCTDTRKLTKDALFFALKGPNFNGNAFAQYALEQGAALAIVDEAEFHVVGKTLLVDDVLTTLQQLATFHRHYCQARIIAITGSNGKTTTKELLYAVLAQKYRTIATQGNLNNHIGVPLMLLNIRQDTEFAIVEMGANHQGEIALLAELAQPDYGYITNFGKAHLEGFGGVAGVIKGKSELYNHLFANDRHVFLNADDPIQRDKLATYFKKIGFSQSDHQYYNITLTAEEPFLALTFEDLTIQTQLIGNYNFPNCCAAITVGKYFGVDHNRIKKAIESYIPTNNRSQLLTKNGLTVVLDAYNANPTSMKAALESFAKRKGDPKTVFLGDMFELGETAQEEHQRIADLAAGLGFDALFLVGAHFEKVTSPYFKFPSFEALANHLKQHPLKEGQVLIKGSRGMAMERILTID
ncbi:MAG: UDP-N-acetylmuramoyl-tripeptide--D-alanyl-D-alanine ligase [Bacteroidota bacterium]